MHTRSKTLSLASAAIILTVISMAVTPNASAHCDALDGPLVKEARQALAAGDVTPLLKWVQDTDEAEIRRAFNETLALRKKDAETREVVDRYFLETLVRIHRAGEGAPYTGLKPAGAIEPALMAADSTLETGSADALADKIAHAVRDGILSRYAEAAERKAHVGESVEAGRQFIEAYVQYLHFIEGVHTLVATGAPHAH